MIITPTHVPKIIAIKNTTPPTRNDLHTISLCEKYIFSSSMFVRWVVNSQKNGHD